MGASVAVNGCCLTAADIAGGTVRFDLVAETVVTTNLGDLRSGSQVNVERSLRLGDELGGHLLSGHVAATVPVIDVVAVPGHRRVTVEIDPLWMRYLSLRGFIALNGASLTIADLDRDSRTVAVSLIPETLARTTFSEVRTGDRLNLEVDPQTLAVVDTVASMLSERLGRGAADPEG